MPGGGISVELMRVLAALDVVCLLVYVIFTCLLNAVIVSGIFTRINADSRSFKSAPLFKNHVFVTNYFGYFAVSVTWRV
jgi:hypothetical protein